MMASSSSTLLRLASSILASLPEFTFDLQFVRVQAATEVPSMLFTMVKGQELTIQMPGLKQTETEEGVWFSFDVSPGNYLRPGMGYAAEGFNFFFKVTTPDKTYLASFKVPKMYDPHADWKIDMKNGVCSVCLPTQKTQDPFLAAANVNRLLTRPTPYCQMFDRSDLGRRLCEVIGHPGVKSKSFTAYKKDADESIFFKGNMPGLEKTVVTKEGLCVSLSMPGFQLQDVEAVFEYGMLIVEGKKEGEHHIAGVQVPEGFCRENDVIKREMKDGVFKATLPRV